jgi:hypothetical protein
MNRLDYDNTIVDCPSLRLRGVPLRAVEREVQRAWRTMRPIRFVLHKGDKGNLTVISSIP